MTARRLAAVFGFLGVGFGAFGRHWMGDRFTPEVAEFWRTAVLYHLVHAAAMLATGRADGRASAATLAFAAGITLFSGAIYAMSLTDVRGIGQIAAVGGMLLMAGWILLFLKKWN